MATHSLVRAGRAEKVCGVTADSWFQDRSLQDGGQLDFISQNPLLCVCVCVCSQRTQGHQTLERVLLQVRYLVLVQITVKDTHTHAHTFGFPR